MAVSTRHARALEANQRLRDTDGFVVASSAGDLGRVEEVWLGQANEPLALAVRTTDGRHALLLGDDVITVDRDQGWVVVSPQPRLLELGPPHLERATEDGSGEHIVASWATTGASLPTPVRPARMRRLRLARRGRTAEPAQPKRHRKEQPVWHIFAFFYALIAFAVAFVITLAFVLAWLVTGSAY